MPTREELAGALRKADAAGNVEDARRIADAIRVFDAKAKPAAQTVNPMVAQGQAAQHVAQPAGADTPSDYSIKPAPQPSRLSMTDLRNINRAPQVQGPGYAEAKGSEIGGEDLQKTGRTLPQHLGNAAIGAAESTLNLPADLINSSRQANAAHVPTATEAMRNANRMPLMAERVGTQPTDISQVPQLPTIQAPRIPIAEEDQSVTGAMLEGLAQYLMVRVPLGKVAKGGGIATQLGKDIASTGLAFQGDTGRVTDLIDPNTIPEGPLRDYAAWLKTQPEDSPIVGRFKNMLEDATISGPLMAPHVAVRGAQALGNALSPQGGAGSAAGRAARVVSQQAQATPQAAPQAAPVPSVAQPPVTAVPPTQPRPASTGQQPNAGNAPGAGAAPAAPAGQPVLNATQVPPPATPPAYTVRMANSDAKIIGRILRDADIPRNDVKPLLADTIRAYQSFVAQAAQRGEQVRLPLTFFAEDYLATRLPAETAQNLAVKLRAFGNAANNSGDLAKTPVQRTAQELRGSQEGYLSDIFEKELGDKSLLTTTNDIRGAKRLNADAVYRTAISKGQQEIQAGKAKPEQSAAFDKLLGRLRQKEFFDRIPYELKVKAGNDPNVADLSEYITDHPLEAAHWLQSELGVLARKGGENAGAYHQMRMALLRPLEDAVPGYRGARMRHGDLVGQDIAVSFGDDLFRAGRTELQTAQMAEDFKRLSPAQKEVAERSIRDKLKNEFRASREDSIDPTTGNRIDARGAKLTELQKAGTLDAIEQILGAKGKRIADGIRTIMRENPRIPSYGSDSAKNLAEAKAIGEAVKSPLNRAVEKAGDKTSFLWTIPADFGAAAIGAPPLFTAAKLAGMGIERFGKPTQKQMASAARTLYELPPRPANALATPPAPATGGRRPPAPRSGPRPPVTEADIEALRKKYDALDHGKAPKTSERLARQIVNAEKRLAAQKLPNALASPSPPPVRNGSGPINKAGFGGSSLDMSEPARMQRAREQGFDVDTRLYHGTNQPIDSFDGGMGGRNTGSPSSSLGVWLSDSPAVADEYAAYAGKRLVADTKTHEAAVEAARKEAQRLERIAQRTGQWDAAEAAMQKWEDLETGALQADDITGQNTVPVFARLKNPKIIDFAGERPQEPAFSEMVKAAKAAGHDGVIFKNMLDNPSGGGPAANHYVIFDPKNIRGKFAAFDPSQSGSSKLLAGMGGRVGSQVAPPAFAATVASVGPEGEPAEDKWARMAAAAALTVGVRNLPALRNFASKARGAGGANQATFGGINAKTADLKLKGIAEQMEKAGAGRDQIWKETGWFKGNDGKWRFEIPDNDLQVRPEAVLRGKGVLNDFVSDADAGGSYPELANIPTRRGEGYYQPPEQFADEEISFSGRGQNARSVIAHERQHAIQDMEGFATGESNSPTKFAFDAPYQAKWDAIVKEKREIMNAVDIGDLRKRQAKGERISPNELPYLERFNELEAQQQPMMRDLLLSPEDTYRRSAGEVEARNVQKRLDMTPEERRRTPPWVTQDTPDDKQVISIQRGGGRKSAPPAQAGFSFGGGGKRPPNALKDSGMPGPISPRVLEDATKAAGRLSPEVRNKLRANAFSDDPAPAMQASSFDPNLFSFAQDARTPPPNKVQNAFARLTGQPTANPLERGLQKSIESVAGQRGRSALRVGNEDVPDLPFGMRMAMGERNATRKEQALARRAYTRAEKADKLDADKVKRVVVAEREARVAQEILDQARLDAFSAEDVGAIVREQMDAIAKAMNREPPSTLGLPTKGQRVSDALDDVVFGAPPKGARARPKAKDATYSASEADDAAKLLFSKEYARVWDDIVSGRTPVESIKPGSKEHLVLTVAAVGGIGALGVTSALLADRSGPMQEPHYPKPEDPRVHFDWTKQRTNRRFVENLQTRFNQIDRRYQLREDGIWSEGGDTDKVIRFWQDTNGFAPDGNLTEDQVALIEEQAIETLRAEPVGGRSGQPKRPAPRNALAPAQ